MTQTIIICKNKATFEAVVNEMLDWRTEFLIIPQSLMIRDLHNDMFPIFQHLSARRINMDNVEFATIEKQS